MIFNINRFTHSSKSINILLYFREVFFQRHSSFLDRLKFGLYFHHLCKISCGKNLVKTYLDFLCSRTMYHLVKNFFRHRSNEPEGNNFIMSLPLHVCRIGGLGCFRTRSSLRIHSSSDNVLRRRVIFQMLFQIIAL